MPADTPTPPLDGDAERLLPENADERRMFDDMAKALRGGNTLRAAADTLANWHHMDQWGGSFGKMLAILSNECATASAEIACLIRERDDAVAERDRQAENGWLIERYINNQLHYWNAGALGKGRKDGFTSEVNDAVRFSREEDASIVLFHICDGQGRVAGHTWMERAAQPSAEPTRDLVHPVSGDTVHISTASGRIVGRTAATPDHAETAREAENLAQQLIDGANREGVDTYTKTLLWHASSLIDRQNAGLSAARAERALVAPTDARLIPEAVADQRVGAIAAKLALAALVIEAARRFRDDATGDLRRENDLWDALDAYDRALAGEVNE